jgi:hypothetical protein
VSEDEKRGGGPSEGDEGTKVPAPPKLTLDPEEKASQETSTQTTTPTQTTTSEPEAEPEAEAGHESRRKRRKRPSEPAPAEKVEAQLVAADLPAKSRVIAASEPAEPKSEAPADRMDLPKWNRARVKRKQVAGQEEDAFQAGVRKAGQSAVRRAPLVLGLIVLVSAGIAGVV